MNALLFSVVSILLGAMTLAAQTPWASITGVTEATLDSRLDHWGAGYDMHLTCLSGYEEGGVTHYAALWTKRADTQARHVLRGVSAGTLIGANSLLQSQGYRLVWLSGFESGGQEYYNAIYRLSFGASQLLRLGESQNSLQTINATYAGQGYYLENLCVFQSGLNTRYGAWWNEGGIVSPTTSISYSLTGPEYQQEFNLRAGTWRLHNVCGYANVVGDDRFTVVWRRPAQSGAWSASHGMSKANYFALQANQTTMGRRPSFQQAWANGSAVHFNAIWIDNGGLAGNWVDQIDSAVASHMSSLDIPGLTLAVSRRGQLVYARGYGFSSLEASELAGSEHRFRVASVSKAVTGVSVVHALERYPGRTLNSRMFGASNGGIFGDDYGTPPYSLREREIRLTHLLHHTAGWADDGNLWYYAAPAYGSQQKPYIDYQLDSEAQTSDPGDVGRYSNLGFCIAARVVEKLSGETFEDYTINRVLASCGISGATRMAIGERTRAQKQLLEASYYPHASDMSDPEVVDPRRMDGSTAWIARPIDLLLLARRVDGNTVHTDILSEQSVTDLHTPASPQPNSASGYPPSRYGLGWYSDSSSNPTRWGHNGGMAGTRAEFHARLDGFSYAWMSNVPVGDLNGTLDSWISQVTAARAWPEIDLFYSAHPAYDAWAADNFSSLDRGQPGLRETYYGPNGDADGDRIPNAGEAFHGLDPLADNPSPLAVAKVGSDLRVRWQRSTSERGVVPVLQTSSDLQTWATPIGISIVDRPDLISTIGKTWQEVLIPTSSSRRFARLLYRTH